MTQHELGRLVSSQIYEDVMDKKLVDEMLDKFTGHSKIVFGIKVPPTTAYYRGLTVFSSLLTFAMNKSA
jgi:hypothetical protein